MPMALLPVMAFLCGAGLLANPWTAVAATILTAGHIPASLILAGL